MSKVSASKTVPSHMVTPPGIQLNPSIVHKGALGVYCTVPIAEGQLFGPFAGEVILEGDDEEVNYRFAWEVYDQKTNKLLHIINATKPKTGNWMRYVNCARFFEEQNIVSIQKGSEIFYKAIRPISAGEELLTWFAPLRGKRHHGKRKPVILNDSDIKETRNSKKKSSPDNVDEKMKHLLLYEYLTKDEKVNKVNIESKSTSIKDEAELKTSVKSEKSINEKQQSQHVNKNGENSSAGTSSKSKGAGNGTSWLTPDMKLHSEHSPDKVYHFVLREEHKARTKNGGIMYACDICGAPYNRMFSLKRHIIRQHINAKYLTLADITNCMVNVVQQEKCVKARYEMKKMRKAKNSKMNGVCDLDMPGLYRCFVCSELFDFAEDLREHECDGMNKDKTKLHSCPVCHLKFVLKVDLTRHKITHAEGIETAFPCEICGKTFMSVTSMKKHIQFHAGNNFSCKICPTKFPNITELRKHINSSHSHSKLSFKKLKQKMKVQNEFKTVLKTESSSESDKMIPQGPDSADGFRMRDTAADRTTAAIIKKTKKKNGKKKKVKQFKRNAVSGDKQYICNICGKAFPNGGRLKMHLSYHKDRVYSCRFCNEKYGNLSSYRKHLRNQHPESLQNGILIRGVSGEKLKPEPAQEKRTTRASKRQMSPVFMVKDENSDDVKMEEKDNVDDKSSDVIAIKENKEETSDVELWEGEIRSPISGKRSRFNFACTVCKRKFNCYVNMCRHRRIAHRTNKYGQPTLIRQEEAAKLIDTVIFSDYIPIPTELSYENVSENIATNLNNYLDGGMEAMATCHKYIKIHDSDSEMKSRTETSGPVTWTNFNFPSSFQPWEGVVGYDIDEELLKVYDDLDIDKPAEGRNVRRKCRGSNTDEKQSQITNEVTNTDRVSNGNETEGGNDTKVNCKTEIPDCECLEKVRKSDMEINPKVDSKNVEKEKKDIAECQDYSTASKSQLSSEFNEVACITSDNSTEDSNDSGNLRIDENAVILKNISAKKEEGNEMNGDNNEVMRVKDTKSEPPDLYEEKEVFHKIERNEANEVNTGTTCKNSGILSSDLSHRDVELITSHTELADNFQTEHILSKLNSDEPPLLTPANVNDSRRSGSENSSDEDSFGSPPPLLSPKDIEEEQQQQHFKVNEMIQKEDITGPVKTVFPELSTVCHSECGNHDNQNNYLKCTEHSQSAVTRKSKLSKALNLEKIVEKMKLVETHSETKEKEEDTEMQPSQLICTSRYEACSMKTPNPAISVCDEKNDAITDTYPLEIFSAKAKTETDTCQLNSKHNTAVFIATEMIGCHKLAKQTENMVDEVSKPKNQKAITIFEDGKKESAKNNTASACSDKKNKTEILDIETKTKCLKNEEIDQITKCSLVSGDHYEKKSLKINSDINLSCTHKELITNNFPSTIYENHQQKYFQSKMVISECKKDNSLPDSAEPNHSTMQQQSKMQNNCSCSSVFKLDITNKTKSCSTNYDEMDSLHIHSSVTSESVEKESLSNNVIPNELLHNSIRNCEKENITVLSEVDTSNDKLKMAQYAPYQDNTGSPLTEKVDDNLHHEYKNIVLNDSKNILDLLPDKTDLQLLSATLKPDSETSVIFQVSSKTDSKITVSATSNNTETELRNITILNENNELKMLPDKHSNSKGQNSSKQSLQKNCGFEEDHSISSALIKVDSKSLSDKKHECDLQVNPDISQKIFSQDVEDKFSNKLCNKSFTRTNNNSCQVSELCENQKDNLCECSAVDRSVPDLSIIIKNRPLPEKYKNSSPFCESEKMNVPSGSCQAIHSSIFHKDTSLENTSTSSSCELSVHQQKTMKDANAQSDLFASTNFQKDESIEKTCELLCSEILDKIDELLSKSILSKTSAIIPKGFPVEVNNDYTSQNRGKNNSDDLSDTSEKHRDSEDIKYGPVKMIKSNLAFSCNSEKPTFEITDHTSNNDDFTTKSTDNSSVLENSHSLNICKIVCADVSSERSKDKSFDESVEKCSSDDKHNLKKSNSHSPEVEKEHVKLLQILQLQQQNDEIKILKKDNEFSSNDADKKFGSQFLLPPAKMFCHFLKPTEDPLQNYEHVMFGKQGKVVSVCAVCRKQFISIELLMRHHWKKHPSIDFKCIEVEQGSDADLLYFPWPCNFGLLASALPIAEDYRNLNVYTCTRCARKFKNINRLHVHIINCDPQKEQVNSDSKKKKIQKRFKSKVDYRSSSNQLNNATSNSNQNERRTSKRGFTGCRKRRIMRNIDTVIKVRKKRNYELLYNPHNHVRRREMISLLETHQCSGCKAKFKTLHLLERHATKCSNKETLQSLKPVQNKFIDEVTLKRRHICHYCSKHFIYLKSLVNHYRAFCSIRKEKRRNGLITDEDLEHEKQVKSLLEYQEQCKQEAEQDKMVGKKKKGGWPKGMKRKKGRKKRTWTIVKRRKTNSENDGSSEIISSPLWNLDLYQDYSEVLVGEVKEMKFDDVQTKTKNGNDVLSVLDKSNSNLQKTPERKQAVKRTSRTRSNSLKKNLKTTVLKKTPADAAKLSPGAEDKVSIKQNLTSDTVSVSKMGKKKSPLNKKLQKSKPVKKFKQTDNSSACAKKKKKCCGITTKAIKTEKKKKNSKVSTPSCSSIHKLPVIIAKDKGTPIVKIVKVNTAKEITEKIVPNNSPEVKPEKSKKKYLKSNDNTSVKLVEELSPSDRNAVDDLPFLECDKTSEYNSSCEISLDDTTPGKSPRTTRRDKVSPRKLVSSDFSNMLSSSPLSNQPSCSDNFSEMSKKKSKVSPRHSFPNKFMTKTVCGAHNEHATCPDKMVNRPSCLPKMKAIKRLFQNESGNNDTNMNIDMIFKKQKSNSSVKLQRKAASHSNSASNNEPKQKRPRKTSPIRASKLKI